MKEKKSSGMMKLRLILLAVIVLLAVVLALNDIITDIIWYRQQGYLSVYLTELLTKLRLGVPAFVVITVLAKMLLGFLRQSFVKKSGLTLQDDKSKKVVAGSAWLLSAVFAAAIAVMVVSPLWFNILEFFNSTSFGIDDPLFSKDVSFYIFKLDFLKGLASCAINIVIALAVMLAVFYLILASQVKKPREAAESFTGETSNEEPRRERRGSGNPFGNGPVADILAQIFGVPGQDGQTYQGSYSQTGSESSGSYSGSYTGQSTVKKSGGESELKTKAKALLDVASGEVTILGVLLFVGIAVRFYLLRFNLLYGGTGVAYGAGYTDIKVTLTVYYILIALALGSAVMLIFAIKKRSVRLALMLPALMVVVSLLGGFAATGVQSLIVAPDELSKESRYLENNIKYTRLAYNLQDIKVKDFAAKGEIGMTDVLDNMETFSNVRINDFDPAKQFYNQTQSIRTYYNFNDVDVDRYYVNGEYTQCFLSAREIDQALIEDSWLIRHLKYTHGYGITLSRVDKVTSSGQPDMLIDSIPPVSEVPEIEVQRPEIYYGESTGSYVITNTGETEFDYPSGESNVYCVYDGDGGIRLTPLNRLLFAMKERSLKILISTNINSDSRIHIYRNIMTRARKIAPFLTYNDDPYIVCADGSLYWILDAYTTSELYPYSEPYSNETRVNYIRNSVKVIINAYDGDIDYYICDETDPLVNTLAGIYPGLFKPLSAMPESLRVHMQYPNALFDLQAYVYTKYHMTDVAVFYQSEDLWSIADEQYGQSTKQMEPNYFIMKLPGEESAEFVSALPYTPSGKANLTGILTARQDGENYGQLVLYRMPKDRTVYGPSQIEAQINQDAEISKEFSLWNNSGSSYLRGNMFVIPVEDTLLYVEPIYLEASTGSLPEVKRVVAYYGDKVAYEATLADCLDSLFGKGAGDPLKTAYPIVTGHQMAEDIRSGALKPGESQKPEPGEPAAPQQGAEKPELTDPDGNPLRAETIEELAQYAQQAYELALSAMQDGNWIEYGKYMDLLSRYLEMMVPEKAEEAAPAAPEPAAASTEGTAPVQTEQPAPAEGTVQQPQQP